MAEITTNSEQPKDDNLGSRVDELTVQVGELRKQFALLRCHVIDTEEENTEAIEVLKAIDDTRDAQLELKVAIAKTEVTDELKAWFDQKAFDELFTVISRIEALENQNSDEDQL